MSRIDLRSSLIVAPFASEEPSLFGGEKTGRKMTRTTAARLPIHGTKPLPKDTILALGKAATGGPDHVINVLLSEAVTVPDDVAAKKPPAGDEAFGTIRQWTEGGVVFTEHAINDRARVSAFIPGLCLEADAEGLFLGTTDGTRIDIGEGEGEVLVYPRTQPVSPSRSWGGKDGILSRAPEETDEASVRRFVERETKGLPPLEFAGEPRVFPSIAAWVKTRNEGEAARIRHPLVAVSQAMTSLNALPGSKMRKPDPVSVPLYEESAFEKIKIGEMVTVSFGIEGKSEDGPRVEIAYGSGFNGLDFALQTVRRIDILAARGFLAIAVACERKGFCLVSPESIAEMLGRDWRTLNNQQREKFRVCAEIAERGEVRCRGQGMEATVRLFHVDGREEHRSKKFVRLKLNDSLVETMRTTEYGRPTGRGIVIDPRIILPALADDVRFALALEIYEQFSLGWVRNDYGKGQPFRRSLGVLFREAGLSELVEAKMREQGRPAALKWMLGELDGLANETPAYLHRVVHVAKGGDPCEDMVDLYPDAHLAAELSKRRAVAREKKDAIIEAKETGSRLPRLPSLPPRKPQARRNRAKA